MSTSRLTQRLNGLMTYRNPHTANDEFREQNRAEMRALLGCLEKFFYRQPKRVSTELSLIRSELMHPIRSLLLSNQFKLF